MTNGAGKLAATIVLAASLSSLASVAPAAPISHALAIKNAVPTAVETVQARGECWRCSCGCRNLLHGRPDRQLVSLLLRLQLRRALPLLCAAGRLLLHAALPILRSGERDLPRLRRTTASLPLRRARSGVQTGSGGLRNRRDASCKSLAMPTLTSTLINIAVIARQRAQGR